MMLVALDVCSMSAQSPSRGWSNTVYVCIQFMCAIALLITADALVRRVPAQKEVMRRTLLDSFNDADFAAIRFWDNVQRTYECCGPTNASDWGQFPMPRSCCKDVGLPGSAPVQTTVYGMVGGAERSVARGQRVMPVVFGNKFYFFYDGPNCPQPARVHENGCIQTLTLVVRSTAKWLTVCSFVFACLAVVAGFVACARNLGPIGERVRSHRAQRLATQAVAMEPPGDAPPTASIPATTTGRQQVGDQLESLA